MKGSWTVNKRMHNAEGSQVGKWTHPSPEDIPFRAKHNTAAPTTQKCPGQIFFRVAKDEGDFFITKMCTEAAVPGSDSTQTHAYL